MDVIGHLTITLAPDGHMRVDIDLPSGVDCDTVDAELRLLLAGYGIRLEDVHLERRPGQAEIRATRAAEKVGGSS